MMCDDLKEILKVCVDLVCISRQLCELDDGCGADFSEVVTDLKWNRMTLQNRLTSLKK
ncbi:hypothetical protein [Methanobrevibacter sp.]|uniref:hypothetical protein n=1 Tax=Methanobrevibacter sp. TaxID=66852 RepID=UPI00386AA769